MIQITVSLEARPKSENYKFSFIIEMQMIRECFHIREDIIL